MRKKDMKIFFFTGKNGNGFLFIALMLLLILFIGSLLNDMFIGITIGRFIEPVKISYYSLVILPIIIFTEPETLATSFNSENLNEDQIQTFFETFLSDNSKTDYGYMNLVVMVIAATLLLLHYYKSGVKKGFLDWIIRALFLNFFITIPLWGYIADNLFNTLSHRIASTNMHYTDIYSIIQKQIKISYIIFFILVVIISIIGNFIIKLVGKNYIERKRRWESQREIKEAKKLKKENEKKNRKTEYY